MKASLIRNFLKRSCYPRKSVTPPLAYDKWAPIYDSQPDNAVLALESRLFSKLLARTPLEGKTIIDVGCGTGRHWPEILRQSPSSLCGVDPSKGMLNMLQVHYPSAKVFNLEGDRLTEFDAASCDVVISTLALAHISSPQSAIREWCRILREGGSILITDFHPDAISAGMKRSFKVRDETIEIEHHATEIQELQKIGKSCGLTAHHSAELSIDDSLRHLFERDHALEAYKRHTGLKLVFGIHFVKS